MAFLALSGVVNAPGFRLSIEQAGTNSFRLSWDATVGKTYQVQRANALLPTNTAWLPLVTMQATGSLLTAQDQPGPTNRSLFYRVVEFTNSTDTQSPTIVFDDARITVSNNSPALRLTFRAGDNIGVSSVTVREGTNTLGAAVPSGGSNWLFTLPVNLNAFVGRFFSAVAADVAGNSAQTVPVGIFAVDPDLFVPLDAAGVPDEGRALTATTTNQAGAFLYRPGGRPRPGAAPDLFLRFADGATFRQTNAHAFFEFTRVAAEFGPHSPFRFASVMQRTSGSLKQLSLGALPFESLAGLFDLNSSNGMSVVAFDVFPLQWRGGFIDDRGLPGAQFLPQLPRFPIPGWSQALPGLLVDFATERTLRIPLAGAFALPDGSSNAPTVTAGAGMPLWLTLRADGRVKLEGPIEIGWSNGQNVRAQMTFDDPKYCLSIESSSLKISAASNLVDLLPSNPSGCIPATAAAAQLSQATRCLDSYARAFAHFSALVASSASNAPASPVGPPSGSNVFSDALEAWGFSATAGAAQALPLDAIATLVSEFGHKAGAAPELPEVLAHRRALMQARAALAGGAMTGSASSSARLNEALAEAEVAAVDRARSSDAQLSLAAMRQAARLIVETDAYRQQANLPAGALLGELPGLFHRFADRLADRFGVRPGVFVPDGNPVITNINRFAALETLRDIVSIMADAQIVGVTLTNTRLEELTGQIGVQLVRAVNRELDRSEQSLELPAFALAAGDLVELAQWTQLAVFPSVPELAPLADGSALSALGDRMNALALAELERPFGEKSLGRNAAEVRALLRVLREMPGTVTFAAGPFRRAFDKLEDRLAAAANPSALTLVTRPVELIEIIDAGTLQRELGARFNFAAAVNWESNRLPAAVTRLVQLATAQRSWRELDLTVRGLINAADRASLANDENLRRAYLVQAATLLDASRVVARSLLQDAGGALRSLDFALPGDLIIESPAGYLCYDRLSGDLHGAVRGGLRLPKWKLSLTVPNASFDSNGRFDLSAFGQLTFDGGQLSVPSRQPIHVWNVGRGPAIEGSARLTLTNGLRFDASMSLADPSYCFALSARSLDFDLGKQLILQRPTISSNALSNFTDAARDAVATYFNDLNGAFETLANAAGSFPPVDESGFGRPPEFSAPEIQLDVAFLNAWSAEVIAVTQAGLTLAPRSLNSVLEAIQRLNKESRAAVGALADEIDGLARLAERIEMRRDLKNAVELAAAQQAIGVDSARVIADVTAAAQTDASNVVSRINGNLATRLADALDVYRTVLASEGELNGLGVVENPTAGLPVDPCQVMTNASASRMQRAEALMICATRSHATQLGLSPVTGAIANTNTFHSLSLDELDRTARVLLELEVALQQSGSTSVGEMQSLLAPVFARERELIRTQLSNSPSATVTVDLAGRLADLEAAAQLAGIPDDVASLPEVIDRAVASIATNVPAGQFNATFDRAKAEAREIKRKRELAARTEVARVLGTDRRLQILTGLDAYTTDFLTQLGHYFRVLGMPVPPGVATNLDSYVRFKVQELRARPFTAEFLTNRLGEAQATFSAIVALTDWAGFRFPTDASVLTNLQLTLSNYTFSLTAVAEAQKAWWILGRYDEALRAHAEIYRTNITAGFSNALAQARASTLLTQSRIGDALAALVDSVGTEDVVVPLPGHVRLENIFGQLCFNRQTGLLEGCFGGRVEFPDVNTNLFFEVTDACLASDFTYHVAGTMGTPLPFGRATLQAGLAVAGSAAGVANFSGTGTLNVPNGDQGNRIFNVVLSYDASAGRLGFDAQGANLDLRLADDFVLFDAGFGFDLTANSPNGSLRANGSAGLFARQHPLPPVASRTNFHLVVDQLSTAFSYTSNSFAIVLSNGTIKLPDFFHNGLCAAAPGAPATGPQLALVPAAPVTVTVGTGTNPVVGFTGALDFRQLGFNVPGITNLGVEICSARLLFRSNALPAFSNLNATLSIPLPQQTVLIDVTGVVWRVDGFPDAAAISLRNATTFFDVGGLAFEFQTNTTFGFVTADVGGARHTAFSMSGGVNGAFDASLLADAQTSGGFRFASSGSFAWETGMLPQFALGTVSFAGRMKLGGGNGFELLGVDTNGIPSTNAQDLATITLSGLSNVFQLSPSRPFEARISGALGSSEFLFFGLRDAKFVFDGAPPEPQFSVSSLGFRAGDQLSLLGLEALPFQITAGSITFLNPTLPLNQLFAPTNLRFTFSGQIDISLQPPDANNPSVPRLFAALDDVQVSLPNGYNGPPEFSVDTFVLALENLTIGDMAGISGGLAVGNLNNPSELFFAGEAGATFNGVGIKAIVATRLDGLIGVCLSANAGPAGIPLDGGALGGILLVGAEGGVSFLNQFADPCDFKSYLGLSSSGSPAPSGFARSSARLSSSPRVSTLQVVSWSELARLQTLHDQAKKLTQTGSTAPSPMLARASRPAVAAPGADVPCPTGDCPPATLNLLCQRHPSVGETPSAENYNGAYRDRTIFKFSSLDRPAVDELLAAANINLSGSASGVAANFANAATNLIAGLIPRPPTSLPAAQQEEIDAFIAASLNAFRGSLTGAVQVALEAAAGQGRTPLEALYEAAYAGVKCVDITVQLKGTFSYAPVSVALNLQGGAVASTTGSAGVLGSVNLFGLPVGTAEFFYSLTDSNGNPNPSLCGNALAALGPLSLGHMGLAIGCEECVTGTLLALQQFIANLTGQALADAQPILYAFIEDAAGTRIPNLQSHALTEFFGPAPGALLTQGEQVAVLSAVLNVPKVQEFLDTHPGAVARFSHNAIAALAEQAIQLSLNIYNSVNPRLQFCGEVEPKIFGFSLTGGNSLVGARLFADKTSLRADATFSPSYVFGNLPFFLASAGSVNNVVPALDEATLGFSLGLPAVNSTTMHLLVTNPTQFATAQIDHLLGNATLTFGYELSPFGFKLADGEGRIVLPTLTDHPDNPVRRAAEPARFDASGHFLPPTVPDRAAVLRAALDSNVLAQATWAGKGTDLAALFPAGSPEANGAAGKELVRDYFPYGGFLGASKVLLPKPITDAPPLADLSRLFAPPTNVLEQFDIAQNLFNNYVLGTTNVGTLSLYIPFPRPPSAFWNVQQGSQALIDSIARADVAALLNDLSLYPADQLLMRGEVNAQFLGMPIGQATMLGDPAQGLFRIHAGTPAGSWMRDFFDAQLTFQVRRADYIAQSFATNGAGTNVTASPEARLQAALDELLAAASGTTQQKQLAVSNAVQRITDTLPKVSLDVALNNFAVPPVLTNVLTASASARLVAYSPRFNPGFIGSGPIADATRNGGVAFQGQFNFANYVVIDDAELGVALRGTALPVLTGVFDVPTLGVPGLALRDAHFAFHSDPAIGSPYLDASGSVDPIVFGNAWNGQPLLTIRNLTNTSARISARFALNRVLSGAPLPGFSISPARVDIPMLGPSVSMRIHGATTNDAFSFSSTAPWAAKASIVGDFVLKDLGGNDVLSVGAVGQQCSASVTGNGLSLGQLEIVLPTNVTLTAFPGTTNAQTFSLVSGGVTNRILISGDGTFVLDGGIAADVPLPNTGFGSVSAGATVHVDNTRLQITISGNLAGGALGSLASNASVTGVSGTFIATRNGVSLSGVATISPMQFGAFRLAGASGGNISAVLTNFGFSIPGGAKLRVVAAGYPTNDLFTLNAFTIAGNGDFNISAQNGDLNIPGYFLVTTGSFTFVRSSGVVLLDMFAPTLQLFPGKPYTTAFAPLLQHVYIDSTARFYADSGNQTFNLPGAFVARGRLEFGYEPDTHQPGLGFITTPIQFGTVTYGTISNRTINVTNTGTAPLNVDISSSAPAVVTATPSSLNLEPNESAPVTVRFNPPARAGTTNAILSFAHNAPGGIGTLSVTGTVRAVPLLLASSPALDLGDGKLNQTVTRGLRIENAGLTNLLLTNTVLSGPFTVAPTNVTIPPGSNVVLQVRFTPNAISNFSGTLQIRHNDGSGTRTVPLSGSGSVIRWLDLRDGAESFRAVAISGGSNAIAATTNRLFYSDNRGHCWSQPLSNNFPGIRAVAMAFNSATGWMCGDGKFALKTIDGGRTWNPVPGLSGNAWTVVIEQPGLNRAVFGGKDILTGNSVVVVERAGGFDARAVDTNGLQFSFTGLAWANVGAQTMALAQQSNSRILRSTNAGTNWTSITNFGQQVDGPGTLALNSSGVALAIAYTKIVTVDFQARYIGSVYRSTDSGATWTRVLHVTNTVFTGVSLDSNVGYVVGRAFGGPGVPVRGVLLRSGDSGLSWAPEDVEAAPLLAVAARAGETFVAGLDGEIQRRPVSPATRGVLEFDPGSIHFGFVPFGDSAPRAITFFNAGISNITITNVTLQGALAGQFAIGGSFPRTVAPGASDSINVFFNPTTTNANITATLQITANDPEGNFSVPLAGRSAGAGWVLKAPLTNSAGFTVLDVQMIDTQVGYALNARDLYRTTDGGATWRIVNSPSGTLGCMHWIDANVGFIGGGFASVPLVSSGSSFIYRTTNAGTNWTLAYSNNDRPVSNLQVLSGGTGYAVSVENSRVFNDSGDVLKTTNNGLTWFEVPAPTTQFSGRALAVNSSAEVFTSSGRVLYRSGDGGTNWAAVATNASTIRSLEFATASTFALAVGDAGSFERTSSGGDTAAEWSDGAPFTDFDLNSVFMASITAAWTVPTAGAPEARIFRSDDNGATWREELAESPYSGPTNLRPTVVWGRTTITNSIALGTDGSVRRLELFPNESEGIAVSPPRLEFGQAVEGTATSTNFVLRNVGDRVLTVSNLLINGLPGFRDDFIAVTPVPFTVPINGAATITVVSSNSIVGTNVAMLSLVSDGALQSLNVELRTVVAPKPVVMSFATDPPGLSLSIDGTEMVSAGSYSVRLDGSGAGDWDAGSLHVIEAPETQLVNGVTFTFAGWFPFQERAFTVAATNVSASYVASYVVAGEAASPSPGFAAALASPAVLNGASVPAGLPTGPYLRLTQASISNALLGEFSVSGSVFLSAEAIEASLASRAFQLPAGTNLPAVVRVSAGAWRFSLANQTVRLKAQSPGMRVFSNVVNPPSVFALDLNLSNASFRSTFSLPQGVKIAPGLLEVGPAAATLFHTSFISLAVSGEVRALRKPDSGNDWALKQNLNLAMTEGPFTNAIPFSGTVLQIPIGTTGENFVVARSTNNARLELRRNNAGVFSLFMTNLAVDVLGQNLSTFSGLASSSGQLSLSAAAPAAPFRVGPFRWTASGSSSFDWNLRSGQLSFTIAAGTLRDDGSGSVPGWPAGGISVPAITFDSNGDFERTLTMPPSFSFYGINLGQASDTDNRYIQLKRRGGVLSVKLRDRVDFFDSTARVGFDISENGTASGFFQASFGVEFGAPLGYVHFGNVAASFDSSDPSYQFRQKVRVAGNDFRVKFGTAGARACHLFCDDDGCSETFCLP